MHVKLHKCFFGLGVFVSITLANPYLRLRDGATAALRCGGFTSGANSSLTDPGWVTSLLLLILCVNPAHLGGLLPEAGLPGSISWLQSKPTRGPKGLLLNVNCSQVDLV